MQSDGKKLVEYDDEDDLMTDVFDSGLDDDLHDICAMVPFFPADYAERVMGIEELEGYFEKVEEFQGEVPMLVGCMPRASITPRAEPQVWNAVIFEPPIDCMKMHLKVLFIQIRIDGCILVNKVLVDEGAIVNLMSEGVPE